MGNRGSSNNPTPPPKAPSVKEKKLRTPVRRSPTPAPRARSSSKKTPDKPVVDKEKTARRTDRTQHSSEPQEQPITPNKKNRDEIDSRTAKEYRSKDKSKESKESQKKRKPSAVYIDGNLVSKEGTKKKTTSRATPNKTSSLERKKKEVVEKKGGSERSKRKHSGKKTTEDQSAERSVDQTAEKTQDSSARRKRAKAKSAEGAKSTEDVSKKTEKTETTEKTKEEKTVLEFENDDTLVSDAPKRKKYSEDKEENVRAFLKSIIGKGVDGLKKEFNELKKEIVLMKKDEIVDVYSEFSQPINTPKNRYKDVPRLNESKVILKDRNEDQSYIHANYCTTPRGEKRFICTQGPNEATYNDFWTMIYQEETEFIVMLCNFLEMGKPKCDKYFPLEEGEMLSTQDFSVQCMSLHTFKFPEKVTIRKLIVTKKDAEKEHNEREVQHVHWETWPDRGVPPIDLSIFKLLARVSKSKKPIAVHCSAGIGRTGTMVTVQIAMEMLGSGQSLADGLAHVLKRLRKQRAMSVQNENQYIFIHRVLLDYFKDAIDEDETTQFCAEYDKLAK